MARMKIIPTILFALLLGSILIGADGCTTYNTVQYAKGYPENVEWFTYATRDTPSKPPGDHKSHPAYYALTPLTVPVDVVTFPFQFIDFCCVLYGGMGYQ